MTTPELWCYAGIRGIVSFFDPFSCLYCVRAMNEATERPLTKAEAMPSSRSEDWCNTGNPQ